MTFIDDLARLSQPDGRCFNDCWLALIALLLALECRLWRRADKDGCSPSLSHSAAVAGRALKTAAATWPLSVA